MLNKTQFEVAPAARIRAGQTLTLEEYRALQQEGHEPDTMKGEPLSWYHSEKLAGKAENRREAKEILGLNQNDSQYGPSED